MKIAAVVVWYNPEEKFLDNIESYIGYVDKVIIVDNSPSDNSALVGESPKFEYLPLCNNEGIATALNIGLRHAAKLGMTWGLTMDQDSWFDDRDIRNFLDRNAAHFKEENVAIFSPSRQQNSNNQIVECDCVITSGSLTNLSAYSKSTGFDDKMFIDEVDHEYCYRMKRAGFRILKLKGVRMHHTLGAPISKKILGMKLSSANHGPDRKYYMTRNRLYVRSLYPEFDIPFLGIFTKNILRILLLENNKFAKLKRSIKGIVDFKSGKMGKLNE